MLPPADRLDPVVARLLTQRVAPPDLRRGDTGPRTEGQPPTTAGGTVRDAVVDLHDRSVAVRVYEGSRDDCVVVWFHGGGFVTGDLDSQDLQARDLGAATGRTVVSVEYRLAPEHPFPAAHDDAVDVVRWLSLHGTELLGADPLGSAPRRLALAGPSAGANLALGAALALAGTSAAPVALLLAYPMLGGDADLPSRHELAEGFGLTSRAVEWLVSQYVPAPDQRTDPRFALLTSDQLATAPPTVVVGSGLDPLRDDARVLADLLRAAAVRVLHVEEPNLPHGFWKFSREAPVARAAVDLLCVAFTALLDTSGRA